jgi:hypothetical protein
MIDSKLGVHIAHCCRIHGCKYGDPDCPVELDLVEQDYPCESCDHVKRDPRVIPFCCRKCQHFELDGSEYNDETIAYCALNIVFPTKKRTCKKCTPWKDQTTKGTENVYTAGYI